MAQKPHVRHPTRCHRLARGSNTTVVLCRAASPSVSCHCRDEAPLSVCVPSATLSGPRGTTPRWSLLHLLVRIMFDSRYQLSHSFGLIDFSVYMYICINTCTHTYIYIHMHTLWNYAQWNTFELHTGTTWSVFGVLGTRPGSTSHGGGCCGSE